MIADVGPVTLVIEVDPATRAGTTLRRGCPVFRNRTLGRLNEFLDGGDVFLAATVTHEQPVAVAFQRHEARIGNLCGERLPPTERTHLVFSIVKDERRRGDLAR